jgi:hypothetical protein
MMTTARTSFFIFPPESRQAEFRRGGHPDGRRRQESIVGKKACKIKPQKKICRLRRSAIRAADALSAEGAGLPTAAAESSAPCECRVTPQRRDEISSRNSYLMSEEEREP